MRVSSSKSAVPSNAGSHATVPVVDLDRLSFLKRQLDFYRQQILEQEPHFVPAMNDFLKFIQGWDDQAAYEAFQVSADFEEYYKFFSARVLGFTWHMERLTFAEMISKPAQAIGKLDDIIGPSTRGQYCRMAELLSMVDFSAARSFVVMGSGITPTSLFYLHDWTDVPHLLGIDSNPAAVAMAQELVGKFYLDRIGIVNADATTFDYSDFDIIYWDPFATPRKRVLEQLVASARHDSIVILRDPFFTGTLLFERVLPLLDEHFSVSAESGTFSGRFMLKHYILRRK